MGTAEYPLGCSGYDHAVQLVGKWPCVSHRNQALVLLRLIPAFVLAQATTTYLWTVASLILS